MPPELCLGVQVWRLAMPLSSHKSDEELSPSAIIVSLVSPEEIVWEPQCHASQFTTSSVTATPKASRATSSSGVSAHHSRLLEGGGLGQSSRGRDLD